MHSMYITADHYTIEKKTLQLPNCVSYDLITLAGETIVSR